MTSEPRPTFRLILSGGHEILEISDQVVPIGRQSTSRVCLSATGTSRRHAQIVLKEQGWVLQDLGSANGTRVNGHPIKEHTLKHGDQIAFDTQGMTFEIVTPPNGSDKALEPVIFERKRRAGIINKKIDLNRFTRGTVMRSPLAARGADWAVRLFSRAARTLLSGQSLDDMLEQVMDLVFESLPAERGILCLYDEETGLRTPKIVRSMGPAKGEPVRISESVVNAAIKDKNAVLVADALQDERFSEEASIVSARISTAMCAPLYHRGRVNGFIYLDAQTQGTPFDGQCLEVLTTLAVISAVALEQTQLREKAEQERELRSRLARYSSPHIVEKIVKSTDDGADEMIAEATEASVLFADIRGFTALSEKLSPAEVTGILNDVFKRFTGTVFALDGTLDKFMGDGLMAIFGAPLPQADHAYRAVLAGMVMQKQIQMYNATRGDAEPLSIRVGINSGLVIAGDIGSPERKDYTVIGDVVNVASRLESSVAQPGQVVIGRETWEQVKQRATCEALGLVAVKGRAEEVEAWRVVDVEDALPEVPGS